MSKNKKRRNGWRNRIQRAAPPDFKSTLAAIAGGGGSALVGGYLAGRGWSPEMVALAMTVGGGVGAYTLGGTWRTAASGMAAAGAGQLALSLLAKEVLGENDNKPSAPARQAALVPDGALYTAFERARRRMAERSDDDGGGEEDQDRAA